MMDLEKLINEMSSVGYAVESLRDDGSYNRFKVGSGKGTPGYCKIINTGGGVVAIYGDFVSRNKYTWTSGSDNGELSAEDKAKIKKRLADEAKKLKREHEKGAMAARFFWDSGEDFKTHDYLADKKVKAYGLKRCTLGSYAGWLMVPGYNAAGDLRTVQYINRNGQKLFETGGQKKGTFFEIPGDNGKIIICEGYSTGATIREATGQTVIVSFDAGNLIHVAKIIREKYPDTEIILAADNDQYKPDVGNTGVESAKDAAIQIAAKMAVPTFKDTQTEPTDFNDLGGLESLHAVFDQIAEAKPIDKDYELKAEIEKILLFDVLKQEFEIERLSKKYSVRKAKLDQYLKLRTKTEPEGMVIVEKIEPAEKPVDGSDLLDRIVDELNRRVILPDGAAETVGLWIFLTYCFDLFDLLPMLLITSPTHRCGKTTLLEVIEALSCRAVTSSNISSAAVYRLIEQYRPTLLIDEADTFINNRNNPELAGVINSGHTRSGSKVIRCEGDKNEVKVFSTWAPKVIGMIGMPKAKTISDRSFVIQLKRKRSGERVDTKTKGIVKKFLPVRRSLLRWAQDNLEKISFYRKSLPPSGNDRADDNWDALFKIACIIGGDWPEIAKAARDSIDTSSKEEAIGTQLLIDIRDIFEEQGVEKIFSSDLIEKLIDLSDSPWGDWNKGRGITPHQLAKQLKAFSVTSKTMRISGLLAKGYTLDSFRDAFDRYIPPHQSVTPLQTNDFNNLDEKQNVTSDSNVTDEKYDNQLNLFDCYGVTDEMQGTGDKEENNPCYGCNACDQNTMMCHSMSVFEGKSGGGVPCRDAVKTCEYNKK